MSKSATRYLREQVIVAAVINLLLNAGLAWLLYRHLATIPLLGPQSISIDLVVTTFLVALLVTLIAGPLVRRDVGRGQVAPPSEGVGRQPPAWLPSNTILQALALGAAAALLVGVPAVWLMRVVGVDKLPFAWFAVVKAGFAAFIAGCMAWWVVGRAFAHQASVNSTR